MNSIKIVRDKIESFLEKNERFFYLCMVLIFGCTFYCMFARSVITPQTGWWQYMAQRMHEGQLPYKDFYFYLPPLFLLIVYNLYEIFGVHFIGYTLFGFFTSRFISWILMYKILTRFFKPKHVCIALVSGITLTASYLADQCFDYNPYIMLFVIIQMYIFVKMYETESLKKNNIYIGIIGFICGTYLMIKQNVGLVMPPICLVLILLFCNIKRLKLKDYIIRVVVFLFSTMLGVFPCLYYLIRNGILDDCIACITSALKAKSPNMEFFDVLFYNTFRVEQLLFAFVLIAVGIVVNSKKINNNRKKYICVLLLSLLCLVFLNYYWPNLKNLEIYVGKKVIAFVILFCIISMLVLIKLYKVFGKKNNNLFYVFLYCIPLTFLLFKPFYTTYKANILYHGINFSILKTFLLYVSLYIAISVWFYLVYDYFIKKSDVYTKALIPLSLMLLFQGSSLVSAELQELYSLMLVPVVICVLIQFFFGEDISCNVIITFLCVAICITSISEKLLYPYNWHGWRMIPILNDSEELIPIDVDGLEGFLVAQSDAIKFQEIVEAIEENSTDDDYVYQFINIPLFNVLTERKTIYAAIPYFDVCPDDIARESVSQLQQIEPELVLFNELSDGTWYIHEKIFRDGEESGQRDILAWYNDYVKQNYTLIKSWDNNSGEKICLWKKNN